VQAVYQSLLQITYIDKLLDNVRALFSELYKDEIKKPDTSVVNCPFDKYYDAQVNELEKTYGGAKQIPSADITPPSSDASAEDMPPPPLPAFQKGVQKPLYDTTSTDATPIPTPDTSRPSSPAVNNIIVGKGGPKGSRRARKAANAFSSAPASSGDESPARRPKIAQKGSKKARKWDADGFADDDDGAVLDYSAPAAESVDSRPVSAGVGNTQEWGSRTAKGEYVLKDIGDEMDAILSADAAKKETSGPSTGLVGQGLGAIGGLFRNVVGGKTLTAEDLAKPLKGIEEHLLKKNVAREAAVRLCNSVEQDLVGMKTSSFTSMYFPPITSTQLTPHLSGIETTLRASMQKALTKILTATSPTDLLREIQSVHTTQKRPYVISIVGVNGVGKSTNLSKIAYFLLQNKYKVLIAASDTFRSGAVEQLKVHVNNLKELTQRQGSGEVEIFEKGYGKDAAVIARDAITFAKSNEFDIVLIDTAGRRHNDARLMSSLEKFAQLAQPDKILMVGEALVGSDAVSQARNFDAAFGAGRRLDGFIVSKCDTVGDMVGTLVSMVHATGIPVLFLGTGQHYGDLRRLSVESVVGLLMK
jgi:signal recognition particle receptor subunit alpha